ncbi:MAG: alpha-mannosidase [Candidatus Delongbacteria bacterium]|nr:alpha-mannosidase [Candidatus Delongbacteria bacterium]MBN2834350.1 alpha-mannosidase [Candidatus Delongbacteria bacterium]
MQNEKVYLERIRKFTEELKKKVYKKIGDLEISMIYDDEKPIPYNTIDNHDFKKVNVGDNWGKLWGCAWFKFLGEIDNKYSENEYGVLIDISGEGCLFVNGVPYKGVTNKIDWDHLAGKYYIRLNDLHKTGEKFELLVEAGANGLFGGSFKIDYRDDFFIKQAEMVTIDRDIYKLWLDFFMLSSLAGELEVTSPRRKKIIRGLNDAVNSFNYGKGVIDSLEITKGLLSKKANESSMSVYSIGHAHIDLAWLWPIRETRRKGGRTFSTALRMIEEYPDYKFGASQPQLYEWVKEDYPKLYEQIKERVAENRWELQGAMWVEPDMNITGGESLVRQCLYGMDFYEKEFGKTVKNLWLPDVFGYSAALPQILRKSGVDYFMTQKISWNETNIFPYHTFMWKGIDGTEIFTHFLPTNNYNLSNMPDRVIQSEKRFAESDLTNEFMNLYGVGDGGGGPSDIHIELGLRQKDCEGTPKFKFEFAEEFFNKSEEYDWTRLPKWEGELYLELHRGTYTTQAKTKRNNRQLELELRDTEFLGILSGNYPKERIDRIWKDTLLNQFHDILPGSSINWVYKDAERMSKENLDSLSEIKSSILSEFTGSCSGDHVTIFNSLSWEREELIEIKVGDGKFVLADSDDLPIPSLRDGDYVKAYIKLPPMGYKTVKVIKSEHEVKAIVNTIDNNRFGNDFIDIKFGENGEIESIFDKELQKEWLVEPANNLLMYEDFPNNWEAWDVNHFYRETIPEIAVLVESKIEKADDFQTTRYQKLTIGESEIEQWITLFRNSKEIRIKNKVDWKEERKMLRVSAKADIITDYVNCEIQFGNVRRPTHSNTSWDMAKFEICAQRYVDLSTPDSGFALINDCKYGHYVKDGVIELNLLRSPNEPDPLADRGIHCFTYSYLPHKNDFANSDVIYKAHQLNSLPIIHRSEKLSIPSSNSFLNMTDKGVKIEVVKNAEDGNGIIVRMYELYGKNCSSSLIVNTEHENYQATNLRELNEGDNYEIIDNRIDFKFKPFEIKTIRLY